jgi:hypothetical protein
MKPCPFCEKPPSLLYASRDGSFRHVVCTHCGATCGHGPEEAAIAAWNTRPTTRDAALREEGRVQGLEEARQACKAVKAPKGEEYNYRIGHAEGVSECIQAILERKLAHQPDVSQGSAPPADMADRDVKPENVSHAARLADELRKVHPEHGYLYPGECAPCDALHDYHSDAPPAAPQGSPLPGERWEPDYGDVNAVAKIAATNDRLWRLADSHARVLGFNQSDGSAARALFYLFAWRKRCGDAIEAAPARNPPEGGALEGEMADALRAVVVDNACIRFRCDDGCRCSLGHARRALARYDDAHPPVKERP